jgi:integrase
MAGKVKLVKIDTREGRAKLPARGVPYFKEVLDGLHLGYRKGKRRGVWVMRRLVDGAYLAETIGVADDIEPADCADAEPTDDALLLTFDQAKRRAIKWAEERAREARATKGQPQRRKSKTAPCTVADAMETYLSVLDLEKKSGPKSRALANGSILPKLGHIKLRDLTKEIVSAWLRDLAASARRTRSKTIQPDAPSTDEERRRRRNSANRTFNVLRASLNLAFKDGQVAGDAAWRHVKPLREADAARMRWLSAEEMRALVNAADDAFRPLVTAALHSGCRYSELTRLTVADFDPRSDSLFIAYSKSGKPRQITLTRDAARFFAQLCAGRPPHEIMLTRNGSPWGVGMQDRPMRAACAKAGIPHANFHCLRHTYASHAIMDGVSSLIVARSLGHADTKMVEKHYAHLAPKHVLETIQSLRKPLGLENESNVVQLVRQ